MNRLDLAFLAETTIIQIWSAKTHFNAGVLCKKAKYESRKILFILDDNKYHLVSNENFLVSNENGFLFEQKPTFRTVTTNKRISTLFQQIFFFVMNIEKINLKYVSGFKRAKERCWH